MYSDARGGIGGHGNDATERIPPPTGACIPVKVSFAW